MVKTHDSVTSLDGDEAISEKMSQSRKTQRRLPSVSVPKMSGALVPFPVVL